MHFVGAETTYRAGCVGMYGKSEKILTLIPARRLVIENLLASKA
jgi:hypothetical protein